MSFAAEIATFKSEAKSAPPAAPAEVAAAAPEAALPTGFDMPKHGEAFVEPTEAPAPVAIAAAEAAPVVAEPAAADGKEKIKIGTREFTSVEDAMSYALELEQGRIADQAYIEGVKAATKEDPKAAPPVETAYEKFSKKVFEDPVEAAKEFAESIKNELRSEYNQTEQQKITQAKVLADRQAQWDTFYQANSDLSSPKMKAFTETLLNQAIADGRLDRNKSSPKDLADLVRKELRELREASLPSKELPSKTAVVPSATAGATPVATSAPKEEVVDFISQLGTLRKKSKAK